MFVHSNPFWVYSHSFWMYVHWITFEHSSTRFDVYLTSNALSSLLFSLLAAVQGFIATPPVSPSLHGYDFRCNDCRNRLAPTTCQASSKHAQQMLLGSLELNVVNDQYLEFMDDIRNPTMSDLRISWTVLVCGGEDGKDAEKWCLRTRASKCRSKRCTRKLDLGWEAEIYKRAIYWDSTRTLSYHSQILWLAVADDLVTTPLQYSN